MESKFILDDSEIINLYFMREEMAIIHTDKKYGRLCKKISMNILYNEQDAEECVNDTYNVVWNQIPPKKPNSLKVFISKIVKRISINRLEYNTAIKRDYRKSESLEEIENELSCIQDASLLAETEEVAKAINDFLESLSERNRNILVLRYWLCESIESISKKTGTNINTVKTIISRERRNLKNFITERGLYNE